VTGLEEEAQAPASAGAFLCSIVRPVEALCAMPKRASFLSLWAMTNYVSRRFNVQRDESSVARTQDRYLETLYATASMTSFHFQSIFSSALRRRMPLSFHASSIVGA
jgi:hypothetical protein